MSGGCALIYEVVWTRLFAIVIGNTVFSVSAILTVFMTGLALGSRLAGRIIDKKPIPLIRTYAALEAAIGLYNLGLPALLKFVDPLYGFVYSNAYQSPTTLVVVRLTVSCALLIVPATLMGATLPVLVRFYVEGIANVGIETGRLYSANTLGAAVGTAAAGLVLIPLTGTKFTLVFTALLNLSIALVAWRFRTEEKPGAPRTFPLSESPDTGPRILLVAMFISGAAALTNEVAWTRVLSLVLGPRTYAFTLMLCSMITGLGLGAAIGSHWTRRFAVKPATFAWVQLFVSGASLSLVPMFGRLPLWIGGLVIRYADSFAWIQILEFLLMFGLMLAPTTLLGMTFPIASKLYAKSDSLLGSEVSAVYALNTAGGIAGSLIAGFILIPRIGSQSTLIAAALANTAAGLLVAPTPFALVVLAGVFMIPTWKPELIASGAYKYATYFSKLDLETVLTSGDLLYFKEGAATTVSARKYRGRVSLSVDGKVDATDAGDMLTQKMLAHLPLLLSKSAKNVAIIGLGSGVTAAAALTHPIEKLDVVEISPEVVEASRFFLHVNHKALMDSRTELIIGDGRNHLRYIHRDYDVIISEPSNPWMAGVAFLFTQEFFREVRSRLTPDGIFCQWLHSYNMSTDDLRTITRTFRTTFPHATLWTLSENDFLLLGSAAEIRVDEDLLRHNFERVADDLREVKIQDLYSIVSLLMLRDEEVDQFAKGVTLNTDDLPVLEFRAARFIYSDTTDQNFAAVAGFSRDVEQKATAENHRHKAEMYLAAEGFKEARGELQRAIRQNADDAQAWKELVETARTGLDRAGLRTFLEETLRTQPSVISRLAAAEFYLQEAAYSRAADVLDMVLQAEPANIEALEKMADALARQQSARLPEIVSRVLRLEPENAKGLYHLATIRLYQNRLDEAIQLVKRSLEHDSKDVRARNLLAIAYGQTFQLQLAETEFKRAIEQEPDDSTSYNNYGVFLLDHEKVAEARHQFQKAVSVNPEDAQGFAGMGETFRREGSLRQARNWYRKALQIDPNHPIAKQYAK